MSTQNLSQQPRNRNTPPPSRIITPREAIQVARLAVANILFDTPPRETFDNDDLAQALALLSNLAIVPIFPEADLTGPGTPGLPWFKVYQIAGETLTYVLTGDFEALSLLNIADLTTAAHRLFGAYLSAYANHLRVTK